MSVDPAKWPDATFLVLTRPSTIPPSRLTVRILSTSACGRTYPAPQRLCQALSPARESGGRIDRQLWLRVAVVDRYQYLVGNELRISGDFVECLHDTAAGPAMKLA